MLYALIIICLIGMVVAMKGRKSASSYPVAGLCGVLGAVLCLVKIAGTLLGGAADMGEERVQQFVDRNSALIEAKMHVMGQFIAQKHPNAKVILVTYDEVDRPVEIMEEGLRAGLGSGASLVGTERIPEKLELDAFNAMVDGVSGRCDVLIVDIAVPAEVEQLSIWKQPESKRPVLFVTMGEIRKLGRPMKQGYVTALIREKPKATIDLDTPLPSGHQAIFDSRYILIHNDNYDQNTQWLDE
jgi:hypothetical protein